MAISITAKTETDSAIGTQALGFLIIEVIQQYCTVNYETPLNPFVDTLQEAPEREPLA